MRRLAALVLLLVAAAPAVATEVMTTVRVFHLRSGRVSVQEATTAVQGLLSENGTMTVQPRQLQLIVQDRPEVVARVAKVLEELERTRDRYRIRVDLLEASNGPVPVAERAEVDARVSRMFRFNAFRRIGTTVFEGEVGQSAVARLGDSYQLGFVTNTLPPSETAPWGIADAGARVHLDRLTLSQTRVAPGGVRSEIEVLRTSVVIGLRQRAIFGASASEGSERALVLILESLPVESP